MVGVVCRDGIILGTEKIVINKMMISGTDKRTYSISREIGCVSHQTFHRLFAVDAASFMRVLTKLILFL